MKSKRDWNGGSVFNELKDRREKKSSQSHKSHSLEGTPETAATGFPKSNSGVAIRLLAIAILVW